MDFNERAIEIAAAQIGWRIDANETAHLSRQLEHIKSQTYDIMFGKLKSRQFIPVDNSADPGAESITYRQWTEFEAAKIISNFASDLPLVDVAASEFTAPVHSIGSAYQWSIQDLRRAAMAGSDLDARRSRACRMSIERKIDNIGAFGEANGGMTGFLNNANVNVLAAPTGTWSGATAALIMADIDFLVQDIIDTTVEVFQPDTLLLDSASFGIIAQTPVDSTNQRSILQVYLERSPYITNIDQWTLLNLADAGGTGPRLVAYQRDPVVLQYNIPMEFEQLPPQARNLSFVVPCHARVGGVEMHYPKAVAYMDGV